MNKWYIIMVITMILMAGSVAAKKRPPTCPAGSIEAGNSEAAYANAVVGSSLVSHADRALGAPDNKFANINDDYGWIILDMGAGEEIVDRFHYDMRIYGDDSKENAKIYVSNSPTSGFEYAGTIESKGDKEVAIGGTSYDKARYVKIYNPSKKRTVEIDAVKAHCIPEPSDNDVPEFGVLAAIGVLIGAGVIISRNRA